MPVSVPSKFSLLICIWCLALVERHSLVSTLFVSVDDNKNAVGGVSNRILSVQKRFFYSTGYGPGGMNNGDNGDEDDDENRQRQRNYSNVDDDDENDRWASTTAAIDDLDNGNVEDPRYSPMTAFNSGDDRLRNRKLEIFGRRATRQDILKKLDHLRRKMIDYYKNRQPPRSVSSPISPFDSAIENKMSELYALIRRS